MNKPKYRQAVLLIHGIGEQRPMATLREFVTALVGDSFRSKPDDLSQSFELRKLTYGEIYQTCFFEYYWAYRFRDTTYRNILEWGKRLVITSWGNFPSRLRWIQLLLGLTIIIILLLTLVFLAIYPDSKAVTLIGAGGTTLFSLLFSSFFLYSLGDAARYLDSLPANIKERQYVRTQGVNLLRSLHEAMDGDKPKYDRIIVIGHSLGSVIGYDILKFYWAEVNKQLPITSGSDADSKLDQVHDLGAKLEKSNSKPCKNAIESYHKAQHDLIKALPSDSPWRITDFVTIGSPLTYADFLIARSKEDLNLLKGERELPTSPPQEDKETQKYSYPDNNNKILHHAAHFALTKWTNLYFAEDIIAGEIGNLFGWGVLDIECKLPPKLSLWLCKWLSHTRYWTHDIESTDAGKSTNEGGKSNSLEQLKKIVSFRDH